MSALAPTLQAFFTDRLIRQRQVSPNTIAAYRDAFKLLLAFTSEQTGKPPSGLDINDLHAETISAFLDHLETDRGNSISTRNARLAAIRSLFRFAALRHPEHAAVIERVLAIPPKRFNRALIDYLTRPRSKRYLQHPISRTGPAEATTPGSRSRSRPACASPSSSGCAVAKSTWQQAPTSPVTAKAARTGSPRSPHPPSSCSKPG